MEILKNRILLILLLITGITSAFAQKTDFKKADLLYKSKSYADAIPLYEKGLDNKKSNSARGKLAFCYKVLNQMDKAEEQYALLVTEKRVRPDVFFHYGEVLMSRAKYVEAKKNFLKYYELAPEKEEALQMAEACDQVPFIAPMFPKAFIEPYPHNTDFDDTSPVFYNNGLVFSSDRKSGIKLLKQKSGATGRDFIRLYYSARDGQNKWSEPKSISKKLNEHNKNNANASFLPDGSEVFFTRNSSISNRKDAFTLQLYSAHSEGRDKWKDMEVLTFCRPAHNYMHPAIAPDGKTLFFVSDKPGGHGGTDIYYSKRKGDKWGKAINLDTMINTGAHEGFPFMNSDGKLYFCSKGHIGYGGFDIFMTQQNEDGTWAKPINVGQPINSPLDDISIYINMDNTKGAFTSSREGGDDDIYLFTLEKEGQAAPEPIVSTTIPQVSDEAITAVESTEPIQSVIPDTPDVSESFEGTPPVNNPITRSNPDDSDTAVGFDMSPVSVASSPSEKYNNLNTTGGSNASEPLSTIDNSDASPSSNASDFSDTTKAPNISVTPLPNISPKALHQISQSILRVYATLPDDTKEALLVSQKEEVDILENDDTANQKIVSDQSLEVRDIEAETKLPIPDSTPPPVPEMKITSMPIDAAQQGSEETAIDEHAGQILSFKAFRQAVNKGKYETGMYYILEDLNYYPGEYLLSPKMTLQLDPIAKMMEQQPELILEVGVHTESIGYDENNLAISKKRAKAIKNYLLYKGIAATRIIDIGFGETQLINQCSNGVVCSEEEHSANRRVEIRVR